MAEKQEVDRLRAIQEQREAQEQLAGDQAADPDERQVHERRAEKAAYLSDKLAEQAQASEE